MQKNILKGSLCIMLIKREDVSVKIFLEILAASSAENILR